MFMATSFLTFFNFTSIILNSKFAGVFTNKTGLWNY